MLLPAIIVSSTLVETGGITERPSRRLQSARDNPLDATLMDANGWGHANGLTGSTRGDFSIFLLRLQWAPEWCCHSSASFCSPAGLTTKLVDDTDPPEYESIEAERLLLHGMWPEWNDTSGNRSTVLGGMTHRNLYWPQYCNASNAGTPNEEGPSEDFGPCFICDAQGQHCHDSDALFCKLPDTARHGRVDELQAMAPDYLPPNTLGDHEWMKHGSCSLLDATEYLTEAMYIFKTLLLENGVTILEETAANGSAISTFTSNQHNRVVLQRAFGCRIKL